MLLPYFDLLNLEWSLWIESFFKAFSLVHPTPPPIPPTAHQNPSGRLSGGPEEARRRQRALVRSTMATRSFSSPQGDLDMHRLRRALERVSFDQTLGGGRLEESDGEAYSTPGGVLTRRSLTDSSEWRSLRTPSLLLSR